jgi:putative Mg2+ transporter-C (MgtC) family protein
VEHLTFAVNIGAAMLMGAAIGLERQLGQHPAGLRTNMLVCVGAAIFVSLSFTMDRVADPTRIAAQVASGIGFLGGGVILREGLTVRGLNTAATLWCTAAVGTLAGGGLVLEALIATATVLVILIILRPLSNCIDNRAKITGKVETYYRFHVIGSEAVAPIVRSICLRHVNAQDGMLIQGISTSATNEPGKAAVAVEIFSSVRNDKYMNDLVQRLNIESGVVAARWERAA